MEPSTIWRQTDGNAEAGQSDGSAIETETLVDIATESGTTIVIEAGTLTEIPATIWTQDNSQ